MTNGRKKWSHDLPEVVELAVGMKVMVTQNVETDLDVTNGARGEIVDIILHSDDPPVGDQPIIKLKCLLVYILVKLMRTRATKLNTLQEGVIPVEATLKTFQISVFVASKHQKHTVHQQQFPLAAAYSFTGYRSQGQTIHYVLVDIAQPPMGTLSLSNLYIALSRSSGWDTIWLLWDFNEQHLQRSTPISWMKMTGWKKWIESQRIGGQGWEGPKLVVTSRLHTSMSMLAMAV